MEIQPPYIKRYRQFGMLTIAAVFFLIFVGGLVRSTGSGMGCPDWPKCFGNWVPPTDVSELPTDYKTKFAVAGKAIADFDVYKTWTEYVNRLIGVLIGFFVLLTLVFSVPYLKTNKKIFYLSLLSFLLVGFQGWIGSVVVSTDLDTWMITIHMIIALIIVALLIYTVTESQSFTISQTKPSSLLKPLIIISLIIALVQTISGTQVREAVDEVALRIDDRFLWSENLGFVFKFHRSWSWLNLAISVYLVYIYKDLFNRHSIIYKCGLALIIIMCAQALTGALLANWGFKNQLQSIHLTLGSITAGMQIFIAILAFNKTKIVLSNNTI